MLEQKSLATAHSTDFPVAGGEMAERMRAMNWSRTDLGPIERWPQSLKTSISICLASRFPIVMYWGPEYLVLYNDAYSTILGSKHHWALCLPGDWVSDSTEETLGAASCEALSRAVRRLRGFDHRLQVVNSLLQLV